MNKRRAVIIDDERLAREELKELLSGFEVITIAGEADDVEPAVKLIEAEKPDLIFLDIAMPGGSGFDVVNQINHTCDIIFVTAYDDYAIRAFEINALDYLTKPVYPARLKKSIERLDSGNEPASGKSLLQPNDYIFITLGGTKHFVKIESIICITSASDYSEIRTTDGKKGLVHKTMQEWEERLPDSLFVRIHRSAIINLNFVEKIDNWFSGSKRVYMKNIEEPLTMSRTYYAQLKHKMN